MYNMNIDTLEELVKKIERTIPEEDKQDYQAFKTRVMTNLKEINEQYYNKKKKEALNARLEYIMLTTRIDGYE